MGLIEERAASRKRIASADDVLFDTDRNMRAGGQGRAWPRMQATAEELAIAPDQAITLNVEWIASALRYSHSQGDAQVRELFAPVSAYLNEQGDWRGFIQQKVGDPQLRALLLSLAEAL